MAQRDYVSRGRSNTRRKNTDKKKYQTQGLPKTTLAVAIALVVIFIGGLYFITHNKQENVPDARPKHPQQNHGLPPKPEERWRYIKELENRPVGIETPRDPSSSGQINSQTQLTAEQRQLLEQMQADMQQPATSLPEVPYNGVQVPRSQVIIKPPAETQQQPLETKPQQQVQTAQPQIPPAETSKSKPAETAQRMILQCGSFRNMDQAESVRASLAFTGIESQITTGGGWHRVVLGPYSKSTAEKMQERLKGAGVSGCILRVTGG
ncbi:MULTISPECIES: cell division protein FtsN [Photorhabdus]|uniref:Cell division protein FtsN n=1 Tax=Photorhabdus asymbiotica subsp. asymbiotica (strain ATCC 43949 / 3105-77) TaxID=553480 RepID=B6VLT7_PHOAA|nr:cell division protein FtsN [Photorhabdus asymbiotica]CAQ86336.1 cell division protein ftsn [Photorhabdus asymbiotica]CAR67117.1 cell division protein sn [Photorhabdus asymbiotica subsp. asymbiotica ATCC 43949]